jgi:hypothetical protein
MIYTETERERIKRTITGVVRLLTEVAQEGTSSLSADRLRDIKGLASGLGKVRLRRLSEKLEDFCTEAAAVQRQEPGGGPELAQHLSDCVQTAKLIKTHLKGIVSRPEILAEVFDCRWVDEDMTAIDGRSLVELAITAEPYQRSHRVDSRFFIDTGSGEILVERAIHYYPHSEETLLPRPATGSIYMKKGQIFPGFPPREVRILECTESSVPVNEATLWDLLRFAHPNLRSLATQYSRFRRNFFAPPAHYALVSVTSLAALGDRLHVVDPSGELLRIDQAVLPQGARCVRLAERSRIHGIFGRVLRDTRGRLTLAPLAALAQLKGFELVRL